MEEIAVKDRAADALLAVFASLACPCACIQVVPVLAVGGIYGALRAVPDFRVARSLALRSFVSPFAHVPFQAQASRCI